MFYKWCVQWEQHCKKDFCSELDCIFVICIEIIKHMKNQLNGH